MQYLYFNCSGQEMTWTNPGVKIVSNSVEIYECVFTFNEDWDGFANIGVFTNGTTNESYKRDLVESSCRIPPEVLNMPGDLYIGVVGTKENKVMPTIKTPTLRILEGVGNAEFSEEPDPTILAQLNNAIATLFDRVATLERNVSHVDIDWTVNIPAQTDSVVGVFSIESYDIPIDSITGINVFIKTPSSSLLVFNIIDISETLLKVEAIPLKTTSSINKTVTIRIYYLE